MRSNFPNRLSIFKYLAPSFSFSLSYALTAFDFLCVFQLNICFGQIQRRTRKAFLLHYLLGRASLVVQKSHQGTIIKLQRLYQCRKSLEPETPKHRRNKSIATKEDLEQEEDSTATFPY
ncbi:hypothetical protein HHK36_021818 [Tetracentron sinense]|uniref:Uncharacterized protein n=1 Tax=Tetracentron sinense TaxID=13715 RepID=A0A835DB02_TETSI|nr:hypothetical protein HHK36_021818 [Tetracentron sinense]